MRKFLLCVALLAWLLTPVSAAELELFVTDYNSAGWLRADGSGQETAGLGSLDVIRRAVADCIVRLQQALKNTQARSDRN